MAGDDSLGRLDAQGLLAGREDLLDPGDGLGSIDLPDLGGSKKIADMGVNVHTFCEFDGH